MSGGHWEYKSDYLAGIIFGYKIDVDYDLTSDAHDNSRRAVMKDNPLGDVEISALVYDVFCLLHSYDWAVSGDIDMSVYQNDVAAFKKRWLKKAREAQVLDVIDICTDNLRKELYRTFIGEPPGEE